MSFDFNSIRINKEIKTINNEIRLIGVDGEQIGVVTTQFAMNQADVHDVDLIEISPNANPPVCKLMEFSKFKYDIMKKQNLQEKSQRKQSQIKEVGFKPNIDVGDYNIKLNKIRDFIKDGYKVKILMKFRGRELRYKDIGMEVLSNIKNDLMDEIKIIQETSAEKSVYFTIMRK